MTARTCFCLIGLNLLIVSALGAATRDDTVSHSHAVDIFRCDFGESSDQNFDLWPDGWTRLRAPGYPQYVKINIADEGPKSGARSLRVKLDGGAGLVSSPVVAVAPRFSYVVQARMKTQGLKYNIASITLKFLDENQQVTEEIEAEPLRGTNDWRDVQIGPLSPANPKTRLAMIVLHVRPEKHEDLRGEVLLADLRMARLPRMTLNAGGLKHLYFTGEPVVVTTDVTGMSAQENKVAFQLLSPYGEVLAEHQQLLTPQNHADKAPADKTAATATANWQPPIPGPGFYRVKVFMVGEDGALLTRMISLAMIDPEPTPAGSAFGWTLPDGERPHGFEKMITVLSQAGIGWVKFPVWFTEEDIARADRLAWFADRLSQNGVEMVGLLDHPPPTLMHTFGTTERLPIALVLNDRDVWQPALDPVMIRLSLKLPSWQLGSDDDISYVGYTDLQGKIEEIKQVIARYGQEVKIGIVWQSNKPLPIANPAPWSFLSFADEPALTATEIKQKFADEKSQTSRWLNLRPLPLGEYNVTTRVSDLVQRMIASRASNVDVAFVPRPFHDDYGLFHADGTPSELFLPWRTTALAVAGRKYLGSLALPGGSVNHVFANDDDAVMVVWNDRKQREYAFLGDNARRADLWGRETSLSMETVDGIPQHVIEVGPEPVILKGLNASLLKWCLSFRFDNPQLESIFGREQAVGYRFENAFGQGVAGDLSFVSRDLWDTAPPASIRFRLPAKAEFANAFPLLLKSDADSGPQQIRIDFRLVADQEYRFSIHRTLIVGLDDIVVDLQSKLEENGDLVVKAHVANHTGQTVNFRAMLFAEGRRRETRQLIDLGSDKATLLFRLPEGNKLVGQEIRLRLEELGGSRVLNQHIKLTP